MAKRHTEVNYFDNITLTFVLLKLKKVIIFLIAYVLISFLALKIFRKRKPEIQHLDMEIIFISVLGAFAVTKLALMGLRAAFGI
jgi:hypothetical protein